MAGNMLGRWEFLFVQIKGLAPFGPIRGKIRKMLINLQKSSSHEPPTARIQVCLNKVPRIVYGPTPGA